ncbi:DNA recombination protein RmuC [Modicisalibacter xianhensis]|uniref:DNA recombination protein RmuC n=1 Tax=Modicisalibacter xianhensis TaxID=442341 RepID=A0A4R8FTD6_9GAMM|nr:DNA recombination protein RmuC [Halomonas xianhensis]TDX29945.1 DNA recombination protein RmuC [Halomonas xianhensis]
MAAVSNLLSSPAGLVVVLAALLLLGGLWLATWRRAQQRHQALAQRLEEQGSLRQRLEQELAHSDAQLDSVREQLGERDQRLETLNERLAALRERQASLETERDQQSAHHAEKLALLEEARERLKQDFEALAGRIFDERQRTFASHSRESLEALLKPFREQVGTFQRRVEELHGQDSRERTTLHAQIEQLAGLNRQMSEEAANLAKALKGDKKMQGNWGEMVLETVLERSGLRRDIEYRREVSIDGDNGRQRPDAVIYLPDDKHLIIDAKVSLNAYVSYVNAEDDTARAAALKAHVQSVRSHVEALVQRDYARLPGLTSPDFVFMFMPVEPAFAVAFEHDDLLFQDAFARHVVVVTPTTLLASLRTVASLWSLERQNENARMIAERAGRLLDKFSGFAESLEEVGRHLERAQGSYGQAMSRLKTGQGNLVSQAVELERLGVRMKKSLPEQLRREAELDEAERPRISWDEQERTR